LRQEFGKGVRVARYGRFLIFYTAISAGIRVERILHGARDVSALFDA
jgi:toxin ParE1/3/4